MITLNYIGLYVDIFLLLILTQQLKALWKQCHRATTYVRLPLTCLHHYSPPHCPLLAT